MLGESYVHSLDFWRRNNSDVKPPGYIYTRTGNSECGVCIVYIVAMMMAVVAVLEFQW